MTGPAILLAIAILAVGLFGIYAGFHREDDSSANKSKKNKHA